MRRVRPAAVVGLLLLASTVPFRAQNAAALQQTLTAATGPDRIQFLADLTEALKNDKPGLAIAYGEEALTLLATAPPSRDDVRTLNELGWAS